VIPAPGEADNLAAIDANAAARHDTAETGIGLATDKATDLAAQVQAEADLKEQQGKELRDLQAQQKANVEQAHQRDQAEYDRYRGMGLKDPDADASFGHRLGAALAIGLGQYSAAMNHTSNKAAEMFEQARRDNFALQKDKIERQKDASIRAGMDFHEAKQEAAQALHDLQIKNVAQIDAFREKFKAESARMGIPEARINATKLMQDTDRQALEARQKHLESQRSIGRDLTPKERGAGKGGGGGAISKLVRMKEAGASDGDIAAAAEAMHIAPKAYLPSIANVDKTTALDRKDKSGEIDPLTVMVAGKPAGLASSSRNVKAIEDRAVQYQDAIDSVKKLQARLAAHPALGKVPAGSDYDRAVLAVAATTQANASDSTTAHEAGTLKNFGLVDEKGLQDTLEHLENRQKAFMGQLRPLATPRGTGAAPRATSAAPVSSDADRAKAILAKPGARDLSPAKRAYLLKLARGAE
jgi:hypothetical protein